jgi:hypothetical protein
MLYLEWVYPIKSTIMSLSCQNLLLAAGLSIAATAHGQSSVDELAGKFVKYVRADRKEKLIVLTDKPFYSAGESIWLKAWCLDSLSNRFIYLSKNLFVDLVDDKDSVISQILFNIPGRKTAGMILVPATLGEGCYWLRAYTNKILKEDDSRMLVKPIFVANPNKPNPHALGAYVSKSGAVAADTSAPRVSFFPEGGSIISGTTATVAFRSMATGGHPADFAGYVTDTRNDTVARFSSAQGMGKFSFDAFNPRKYTAHVNWGGREVLYPLPAIDQFASQLTVIGQDDHALKMQVSLGDSLYKKNKATRILGMSRDSLCFAATGTDMYQVNVPLANFPLGRACFILFDAQGNLVSQRSIYIRSNDSGRIVAATDKAAYSPGDKVNLSIGVKAAHDNPVMTLLSVSVTDDRLTGEHSNADDGMDRLPAPEDAQYRDYSPAALDVLMLTEPPLYTNWAKAPAGGSGQTAARFADSNLLDIRGRAVDKNNAPLQRYVVNLVAADKGLFLADTTDENGRFLFPLSEYDDGTRFNMKLTNLKGRGTEGKLILDKMDYPKFNTPRALKRGFTSDEVVMIRRYKEIQAEEEQAMAKDGTLLKPVTVVGRKKLPDEDEAQRASPFSDVIGPDDLHRGGVDMVYNALSNVPGLTSGINETATGSMVTGAGSAGTTAMLVEMDGVQVNTGGDLKGFLETLDESNIEFIEVLKGPLTAIYGMQGSAGVILIHSVNHNQNVVSVNDKGISTIYPKGYANQQDVFAAAGNAKKKGSAAAAASADASTLYWNASLPTDNLGNAKVDFFTGSRQATYSATIIGVTPGGDIVEKTIQIKCR